MRTWLTRLIAAIALVLSALLPAMMVAPPAGAVPPSINSLRTDGHTVVWIYSYYTSTLYAQTIGDSQTRAIAENVGFSDVSGDRIVWQTFDATGSHLGGESISTGTALNLPDIAGQQTQPSISGTRLVWINRNGGDVTPVVTVMSTDLATDAPPAVVATLPNDASDVGRPEVSGDRLVWSLQFGAIGTAEAHWQLWTAQIGQAPQQIASGSGTGNYLSGYDISGYVVTYAVAGQVHLVSVDNPSGDRVIGAGGAPTVDGRYIFWNSPLGQIQQDINAYDIGTDSTFVAVADGNANFSPRTDGGIVVWVSAPPYSSSYTVKSRNIGELLPSAPRPDPGTTSPNWFYFPETSHYLASGFKQFWEQSGGLPVFGYPLTEEFTQHDMTVQYLERQRFEYHPEFAGTPYETELGLLGVEAATTAGLLGSDSATFAGTPGQSAFAPLPATTPGDANCTFMPETGHRVCFGFKEYWESHGLDFGDPGISFRESLALFGYPISEEFTDPATGMTVQYFERAVFEYHPANPDPFKVELRRLGAQRLSSFDW